EFHDNGRGLDDSGVRKCNRVRQAFRVREDREFNSAVWTCDLNFLRANALRSPGLLRLRLSGGLRIARLRRAEGDGQSKHNRVENIWPQRFVFLVDWL